MDVFVCIFVSFSVCVCVHENGRVNGRGAWVSLFQYWMSTGTRFIIDWIISCNHILCGSVVASSFEWIYLPKCFTSTTIESQVPVQNATITPCSSSPPPWLLSPPLHPTMNEWVLCSYFIRSNVEHCVISWDGTFPLFHQNNFLLLEPQPKPVHFNVFAISNVFGLVPP